MRKNGFSVIGLIFCVLTIGLVVFAVLWRCRSVVFEAKEITMKAELRNLNTGIQLYCIKYGSFPLDIRYYLLDTKEFLQGKYRLDKDNYPLDPFGKRYQYEPETGRVNAQGEF